ncbi:Protein of unknown function [Anaerosphaera aminiphila DSM 21120]|uniref:Uncharacterized protein n=1 Tax=Anaerosphaera aminiphila DSM 21120 TaxID=1120995 RepID=A0A1M5NTZ9_9FIRM|nr:DUF1292 domain-containing protein [Anaerosphaera aminiphila]SHG92659.1 Protein of unknown function [Anaerosphaera aminiphila DSM 21120]
MTNNKSCCGNDHNHEHNHECCNHNHDLQDHDHEYIDEEFETIILTLEDDSELECIVLGVFDFEDKSYIALVPSDEKDGEEVLIYDYLELENDEMELNVIEDEELFNRVSKEFENLFFEEE